MSGKAKDLLQMDLYGLLGIEGTATPKEVCLLPGSFMQTFLIINTYMTWGNKYKSRLNCYNCDRGFIRGLIREVY